MRYPIRIIVMLGAFVLTAPIFTQELPLHHYSKENDDNFPLGGAITRIHQDRLGFMWFSGADAGIKRFDGYEMLQFELPAGLPDTRVYSIREDHTGRLWLGTGKGITATVEQLQNYQTGRKPHFTTEFGNTRLATHFMIDQELTVDVQGDIWFLTDKDSLARYRWQTPETLTADTLLVGGLADDKKILPTAITFRQDTSVWLSFSKGLMRFPKDTTTPEIILQNNDLLASPVLCLYESADGILWGGAANGSIWQLDETLSPPEVKVVSDRLSQKISEISEIFPGEIWAASFEGVLQVDMAPPHASRLYNTRNGFLSDIVWDLRKDREGNIWFGQQSGVSKLRSNFQAFEYYTAKAAPGKQPYLPASGVLSSAYTETPEDQPELWIGTEGGLVGVLKDGRSETIRTEQGLKSNIAFTVTPDSRGRLWVGTQAGLNCLSPNRNQSPFIGNSPSELTLFGKKWYISRFNIGRIFNSRTLPLLAKDGQQQTSESIWFNSFGQVVCGVGDSWFLFRGPTGLKRSLAWSVEMAEDGKIWVCNGQFGVVRSKFPLTVERLKKLQSKPLQNSGFQNLREISEPVFEAVWDTTGEMPQEYYSARGIVRAGNAMWVTTHTTGVLVIEGEPAKITTVVSDEDGLATTGAFSINYAPETNTVWVGTSAGLHEFDAETREIRRIVTKQSGLTHSSSWGMDGLSIDPDGAVLYATPMGLSRYQPELNRTNEILPVPQITSGEYTENGWGSNEINLKYSALSFANERNVRYKIRLNGYDESWSEETAENKIRYTNLPAFFTAKDYTFEVLASNNDGLWTESPVRYTFPVTPAWWQRWWAVLFYAAIFVLSLVGFNKYRTQQLEARSRKLEKIVEERTREIKEQADELETMDGIVTVINRKVILKEVLDIMLEQALKHFPQAEKGAFLLRSEKSDDFRFSAVNGYKFELLKDVALSEEETLNRYSENARQLEAGVYIIRQFQGLEGEKKLAALPVPKSSLAMAIQIDNRLEGFLVLDNLKNADAFDNSDIQKLSRYREHAVSAIAKARALQELQEKNDEIIRTQEQLIVQEKLASLGALTAGIAHEIKNPLNFVNNFADLLVDMVDELKDDIQQHKKMLDEDTLKKSEEILSDAESLLEEIQGNAVRIHEHGKRANNIVNGMLQHSRGNEAEFMSTDINELLEEYINLAFHGRRAQDKSFSIDINEDFDEKIEPIDVVPQDISRVFLNLLNNAFDAVSQQVAQKAIKPEEAAVWLSTRSDGDIVEIRIRDNGGGIPETVRDQIFDPFFTTKATGAGNTGLGLSISHDIVVKVHRGEILVETEPGKSTEFIIRLPKANRMDLLDKNSN